MAPTVIKVDSFDVVIEDFKSFHTQAQFYSEKCKAGSQTPHLNVAGRYHSVCTNVYVDPNGAIEVVIYPGTKSGVPQQFCFRGRVHFVEENNSVALGTVKFCNGTWKRQCGTSAKAHWVYCNCGWRCKIEGAKKQVEVRFPTTDNIPEKVTIRFELEFLPFDHPLQSDKVSCGPGLGWLRFWKVRDHQRRPVAEESGSDGNSDLKRDMSALRKDPKSADIKLICNGKSFWTHKLILSARSDVFAALFSHEGIKEDQNGEIHIEDCDHEAMELFLSYLYEEAAPPKDTPFEVTKQLMNVANKYNFPSLMKMCCNILISVLNEDNAVQMAQLGNLFKMKSLQQAAKTTIAASDKDLIELIENFGYKLQQDNGN